MRLSVTGAQQWERMGGLQPRSQISGALEKTSGLILIVMDDHGRLLYNLVCALKRFCRSGMVVHSFNPNM